MPAPLHNRPDQIVGEVERLLARRRRPGQRVLLGYADCGTGGLLDALCEREDLLRIGGDHCYEFFTGQQSFADLAAEELGTFYLTDYLARHAETLVFGALGITKHPELRELYFGNYRRLVYLAQREDEALVASARSTAERLGLDFVYRYTGLEPLTSSVVVHLARTGD
ncbi:MAG: DUF1638 domain-containing protein [Acidimicrobiales bacterium]